MRIYKLTFKEQQQIVNGRTQTHKNCKVTLPIDIVNELGLSKDNNLPLLPSLTGLHHSAPTAEFCGLLSSII